MPNHERHKWPGVSGEIRGDWGAWVWLVTHNHAEVASGRCWTRDRALTRMFAAMEQYKHRAEHT